MIRFTKPRPQKDDEPSIGYWIAVMVGLWFIAVFAVLVFGHIGSIG